MTAPLLESPHLRTEVARLVDMPHVDVLSETITVEVEVSRYVSEPEPYIFVYERGHGSLLRLTEQDAQRLVDVLSQAILAARVQAGVDLPDEEPTS